MRKLLQLVVLICIFTVLGGTTLANRAAHFHLMPGIAGHTIIHDYELQVLELVNIERAAYGIAPLTLHVSASIVAREKSADMMRLNYFDHTSPTYGSPFEMLSHFGISYQFAGENIAMGHQTPEQVVQAWMDSPGHRENILNSSFTQLGIGFVRNHRTTYWTQLFIG